MAEVATTKKNNFHLLKGFGDNKESLTLVQNEKPAVAHNSSSQGDNLALSYGEIVSTTCNITVQSETCFVPVSLEGEKSRCA